MTAEPGALARVRTFVGLLVAGGIVVMAADLILIGHYAGTNQLIPLVLAGAGLVALGWTGIRPGLLAVRVVQFVMLCFVGAGIIGVTLHVKANTIAVREKTPAIAWRDLVSQSLASTAPPPLSPGLMAQLGLLGLVFCYRHPALQEDEAPAPGDAAR